MIKYAYSRYDYDVEKTYDINNVKNVDAVIYNNEYYYKKCYSNILIYNNTYKDITVTITINDISYPIKVNNGYTRVILDNINNTITNFNIHINTTPTNITISNIDLSHCKSLYNLISSNTASVYIIFFNNINTSNVTDMSTLFYNASGGGKCIMNNLENLDTSSVTNMSSMFANVTMSYNIKLNYNTSNVTNMSGMFFKYNHTLLGTLDISSFDISNVTDMSTMFYMSGLANLIIGNWDLTNKNDEMMFSSMENFRTLTGELYGLHNNISLYKSPLENESAMKFINGLLDISLTDEIKTITFSKTTYNTLTEEQILIATSKGWIVKSS